MLFYCRYFINYCRDLRGFEVQIVVSGIVLYVVTGDGDSVQPIGDSNYRIASYWTRDCFITLSATYSGLNCAKK